MSLENIQVPSYIKAMLEEYAQETNQNPDHAAIQILQSFLIEKLGSKKPTMLFRLEEKKDEEDHS